MRIGSFGLLMLGWGVAAGGGCSNSLAKPSLMAPGPVAYQQAQAQRWDPYPDDSLGPSIAGGRPRDFDRPREFEPLRPNPAFGAVNGRAAPPVQLQPTPAPYSPGPYVSAPQYPQTPYVAPQYSPQYPAAPATGPAR